MSKMTTIRLYGRLGARFGRVWHLALDTGTPAEAIRALCSQVRGFQAELAGSASRGIRYAVFLGTSNLPGDELGRAGRGADVRIAPVMQGAKRAGLFQTVIGVALIAAAAAFSGGLAAAFAAKGWVGMTATIGLSFTLGGVVQMLSPQQRGLSTADRPDNGASYNFNGAVNTSAQGNPIPIGYGRMIVGSAVISAGIYAEDQT